MTAVNITYTLDTSSESNVKILKAIIRNNSELDLYIPHLLTWRMMFGPDQCDHFNLREGNVPLWSKIKSDCISSEGTLPFEYLHQDPSFVNSVAIHTKAKKKFNESGLWLDWVVDDYFDYLSNPKHAPIFLPVKSYSSVTMAFKIKPSSKGKYYFSALNKNDRGKLIFMRRAIDTMKSTLQDGMDGYYFYDGEYTVAPLEVEL